MSNAITINNLSKSFSNFYLEIPYLEIEEGSVTGFVGENGAGKTTTINLIMGMLRRESGEISILGDTSTPISKDTKAQIGYVGDGSIFYPEMKLKNLVSSLSPFYPNFDYGIFTSLIEKFNLSLNKKFKTLSRGQKQIFSIIFALSHQPKLLILDEPTSGLDPAARADILQLISEGVEKTGMSVFLSTHITSDLESIADEIVFIHQGKIIMKKSKDELEENFLIVKGYNKLLDSESEKIFCNIKKTDFNFEGITDKPELAKMTFGSEALYERPSIEDIFISIIRGDKVF